MTSDPPRLAAWARSAVVRFRLSGKETGAAFIEEWPDLFSDDGWSEARKTSWLSYLETISDRDLTLWPDEPFTKGKLK